MFKKYLIIAVVGFAVGYLTNQLLQESVADVQIVKSTQQNCEQPLVLAETVTPESPVSQSTASASSLHLKLLPLHHKKIPMQLTPKQMFQSINLSRKQKMLQ